MGGPGRWFPSASSPPRSLRLGGRDSLKIKAQAPPHSGSGTSTAGPAPPQVGPRTPELPRPGQTMHDLEPKIPDCPGVLSSTSRFPACP
ncbi:hypothetical protein NDU88_001923 [Pleurodeles waltl]|uniref:Uncharacterized protein n=1 Tax=Pleurodeles waltl TaxID=8319 RepID=A0AAV7Q8F5_PLEWA|nr:hypothetical protein NDU88_001923 [Pleurodeles waltl]